MLTPDDYGERLRALEERDQFRRDELARIAATLTSSIERIDGRLHKFGNDLNGFIFAVNDLDSIKARLNAATAGIDTATARIEARVVALEHFKQEALADQTTRRRRWQDVVGTSRGMGWIVTFFLSLLALWQYFNGRAPS